MERTRALAVSAVVGASLLWGTTGTVASFLPEDVSPVAVGASTMGIGGLLLFLTAPSLSAGVLADAGARRWVLVGALGVFVYPLAFYSGMSLAGVAIGNVVALGTGPVVTALFEWLFERHPLSRRWAVSTVLAIAGVALLSFGRHPDGGDDGLVPGILLGLLAGIAYALFT